MFIYSKVSAGLLFIENEVRLDAITILDASGTEVKCPLLSAEEFDGGIRYMLDARGLKPWSPDAPVLYTVAQGNVRFG